jgi:hypothetical protein
VRKDKFRLNVLDWVWTILGRRWTFDTGMEGLRWSARYPVALGRVEDETRQARFPPCATPYSVPSHDCPRTAHDVRLLPSPHIHSTRCFCPVSNVQLSSCLISASSSATLCCHSRPPGHGGACKSTPMPSATSLETCQFRRSCCLIRRV